MFNSEFVSNGYTNQQRGTLRKTKEFGSEKVTGSQKRETNCQTSGSVTKHLRNDWKEYVPSLGKRARCQVLYFVLLGVYIRVSKTKG